MPKLHLSVGAAFFLLHIDNMEEMEQLPRPSCGQHLPCNSVAMGHYGWRVYGGLGQAVIALDLLAYTP